MAETEREIRPVQVRSLAGESTTISISPISTIEELKLKLKESFLPAKNSPNFHLFFKGTKLSLGNQIGNHSLGHDDFLVLVPFTKKERPQTHHQLSSKPTASSQDPNPISASSFSDLAWSDMMSDLSYLSGISRDGVQSDPNAQGRDNVMKESFFKHSSSILRRKRSNYDEQERLLDDQSSILHPSGYSILLQICMYIQDIRSKSIGSMNQQQFLGDPFEEGFKACDSEIPENQEPYQHTAHGFLSLFSVINALGHWS
ncbi:uncharacterized protein LOC122665916 [Telopea speciosissima]|uniref:uncharacterized protein LOC122665916 n=1 Tax=Telopea speciosissima TaxID=54955 RepID=UPI001CC73F93|nr:uncharacterized protein LOC122665916 [Telopea speciosissima]